MTAHDTAVAGTFVLTSGRTGSTLLARLLHSHPEVAVISDLLEPATVDPYFDRGLAIDGAEFWRLLARPALTQRVDYWRRRPTAELLHLPERDEDVSLLMSYTLPFLAPDDPWVLRTELEAAVSTRPVGPAPDHFVFVCRWLADRFGSRRWVERTGGSLPHAEAMIEAWPDAKYIVVTRDLAETALSMRTGSFFRLCLAIEHDDADGWLDPRYAEPARLAAMVDRWSQRAERAVSTLATERVHRLTYEGLTADPAEVLAQVAGFVLDRSPSNDDRTWALQVAQQVDRASTHLPDLESTDAERLLEACRSSHDR